jgi:hypothetical protein
MPLTELFTDSIFTLVFCLETQGFQHCNKVNYVIGKLFEQIFSIPIV